MPAVAVAIDALAQRLNLRLRVLNHLKIRLELRRQLRSVPQAVRLEPLLLLDQPLSGVFELALQKGSSSPGPAACDRGSFPR